MAGAFSGVGEALQGYDADQKAAAAGGGAAAGAAQSNARAIRDATQQIDDAKRQQARTAVASAQQIADAERQIADAQTQAARTARDGAASVAAAKRAVVDAEQSAARTAEDSARTVEQAARTVQDALKAQARTAQDGADAIESAGRRVVDAERSQQRAEEDLTKARQDAERQLESYAEKVHDLALDQEGAQLALQRAQESLTKTNDDALATDLDKAEAAYQVEVAQERVRDLTREQTEATADNNAAQAKGVDGADEVVSAQERVAEATQATQDAQKALTKAQTDAADANVEAARRVSDAQEAQAKAVQDAARANEDAARRVADAKSAESAAEVQAAEANADAQERVEDAERSLAQARQDAANAADDAARQVERALQGLADAQDSAASSAGGAAAGAHAYEDAMKKLSPAAQLLVKQLVSMKPALKDLQDVAAAAFLPGVTQMLKDSTGLFPIFERALGRTGQAMSDTATKMGELFKSAEFKQNLQTLLDSTIPITTALGNAFVQFTSDFVEFGAKMAPVSLAVAGFIDKLSSGFTGFFAELAPHVDSFVSIWDSLGTTMDALLPIVGALIGAFSDSFAPVLKLIAGFLSDNEGLLKGLAPLVATVATAFAGWKIINAILTPIGGLITGLGTRVASLAGSLGASEAATTRIGSAFSRVGSALPLVGAAFAVAGLASQHFSELLDKNAAALLKGGDAARQAMTSYDTFSMDNLGRILAQSTGILGVFTDSEVEAINKAKEMYDAMTPLEQAQTRYNMAVSNFGKDSAQARTAQTELNSETQKAELAQRAAAAGTDEHTQALADLNGQMQTALGADTAYQQSLLTVRDAQKTAAAAVKEHGANSDEAQTAILRVVDASNSAAEAASRKAEADAKAAGITDTSAIKTNAYNVELLAQASTLDGPAQAALLKYTGSMNDSQLSAYSAAAAASGFKTEVLTLPDGRTVTVVADPAQALATLQNVDATISGTISKITIDANPDPANGKFHATIDFGNGSTSTVTLDAHPDPATGKINGVVDLGNGKTARLTLDAKPDPATGKINATVDYGNGKTSIFKLDANQVPGLNGINNVVAVGNAAKPTPTVYANTGPANSAFQDFINWVSRPITTVVNAITGGASGAIMTPMARGGIVGFAGGGAAVPPLTPMSGSMGTIVSPNTWRVIGDNLSVPELFAPLDGSARSLGLIKYGAEKYGMNLTPKPVGGPSSPGSLPAGVSTASSSVMSTSTAGAPTRSLSLGGVTVNVTGVLDFRAGDTATRQVVEQLRARLVEVERSYS
jgi:hypothetical protein